MALSYSLDIEGDRLVARHLLAVEQRTLHPRPAFARIGEQMLLAEKHLFDSEGAYAGRHWRPDLPTTLAEKARLGLDPRVLHATRRLRRSLTQRGNPDQIRKSTDHGVEFGTRVRYAKYQTSGHYQKTGRKEAPITVHRRVPPRPPVQFGHAQHRQFERTISRWILNGTL